MAYTDDLANLPNISFDRILMLAKDNVPPKKRENPWIGLEHGVKLLDNDDELAQYLVAYGQIHREKLNLALDEIESPAEYFSRNITIIDWGCGQGLATICFFDYMRNLGIEPAVEKIILIEPSAVAIKRANEHVLKYTSSAEISLVNKFIDDVKVSDIRASNDTLVLHFFSNILDIPSVHLDMLSDLIKDNLKAEQILFCVGPQNAGVSRIAEFSKMFDIKDDDLIGEQSGQLSVRGTINLMVFRLKANVAEIIKVKYYHHPHMNLSSNTALKRVLSKIPATKSQFVKALQFYNAVIALEKMKSANIPEKDIFYYQYPLEDPKEVKFNIDIQANCEFEPVFLVNLDKSKTKWPKHLNIALCICWNNKIYRLLQYIYPFEDLKDININKQYISVDLSMFSVNEDVAGQLELTRNIIEAITAVLKDKDTTLGKLESILRDAIGHTVSLYSQLSLCLTEENPYLAQIHSELKNLEGKDESPLITAFLSGHLNSNIEDNVSEDDIINVVNMDDSQRRAITSALNSKVSVITGPPGTGKTQMIINLLANAMLKGKSVLVASKNNKAVDNIKDRFDMVDDYQYLLRFGSKDFNETNIMPSLDRFSNSISDIKYDDESLSKTISKYDQRCIEAADARRRIGELVRLTDSIPELQSSIESLTHQHNLFSKEIDSFRTANNDIDRLSSNNEYNWEKMSVDIQKNLNILQSKNRGLKKIFFNIFSKKRYGVQILNELLSFPSEVRKWVEDESGIRQITDKQSCSNLIELYEIELKHANRIKSYCTYLSAKVSEIKEIEKQLSLGNKALEDVKRKIDILSEEQEKLIKTIEDIRKEISSLSVELLSNLIKARLVTPETRNAIAIYQNYLPNNIPWKKQDIPAFVKDARNFIAAFRLNSVTSLSVKSAYPLERELFDMIVIDEASQCDVASALPLLYRAKQVVVIGDPCQLKHITSITTDEEQIIKEHLALGENSLLRYVDQSLWDYCNGLITSAKYNNTHVMLHCHYRCHPQIIGYSNEMFYQKRGMTLKVCTKEVNNELPNKGIVWVDVIGQSATHNYRINEAEAEKAISIATDIASHCPIVSIGIISPFRAQAEKINSMIPKAYRERIVSDTVHKFQGDERDVIIYTLVITDNSPKRMISWIDNVVPNLVNVAVTRARSTLYIIANREYIKKHSSRNLPLGYLAEYTENRTSVTSLKQEPIIIDTNVFVNYPDILHQIDPSKQIVISAKVIDELDKLKVKLDDVKRRNVELALRNINRSFDIRGIRMECADLECLPIDFSRRNPDNLILSVALKYRNQSPTLLTSDNGLQIKAKGLGINTIKPNDI